MYALYKRSIHVDNISEFLEDNYGIYDVVDFLSKAFVKNSGKEFSFKSFLGELMKNDETYDSFIDGVQAVCNTVGMEFNVEKMFSKEFRTEIANKCVDKLTVLQNIDDVDEWGVCICEGCVYYIGLELFSLYKDEYASRELDIEVDISDSDFWVLCEVPERTFK